MTRDEIEDKVVGKRIASIEWRDRTAFGQSNEEGLSVWAIELDDGSQIEFTGSHQVDRDQVRVRYDAKPAHSAAGSET